MVDIPIKVEAALDKENILSLNHNIMGANDRNNIHELNKFAGQPGKQDTGKLSENRVTTANDAKSNNNFKNEVNRKSSDIQNISVPRLENSLMKGQKTSIGSGVLNKIRVCLGWNVKNPMCDVDVSAFLLTGKKVPGDDWFVFYGHPQSPDGSTLLSGGDGIDREFITIDFDKINDAVDRIVFVLTIDNAIEQKLNFSMIQDAYIRIIDPEKKEIMTSFLIDEYYDNVISMMIGEVYQYNGIWKFNAVGNGVARDLAGICGLYGVDVDG